MILVCEVLFDQSPGRFLSDHGRCHVGDNSNICSRDVRNHLKKAKNISFELVNYESSFSIVAHALRSRCPSHPFFCADHQSNRLPVNVISDNHRLVCFLVSCVMICFVHPLCIILILKDSHYDYCSSVSYSGIRARFLMLISFSVLFIILRSSLFSELIPMSCPLFNCFVLYALLARVSQDCIRFIQESERSLNGAQGCAHADWIRRLFGHRDTRHV